MLGTSLINLLYLSSQGKYREKETCCFYFSLDMHACMTNDKHVTVTATETEPKERLDHFAVALRSILEEAKDDPEVARNAPYTAPVRRLDEVGAAKRPVVRQPL